MSHFTKFGCEGWKGECWLDHVLRPFNSSEIVLTKPPFFPSLPSLLFNEVLHSCSSSLCTHKNNQTQTHPQFSQLLQNWIELKQIPNLGNDGTPPGLRTPGNGAIATASVDSRQAPTDQNVGVTRHRAAPGSWRRRIFGGFEGWVFGVKGIGGPEERVVSLIQEMIFRVEGGGGGGPWESADTSGSSNWGACFLCWMRIYVGALFTNRRWWSWGRGGIASSAGGFEGRHCHSIYLSILSASLCHIWYLGMKSKMNEKIYRI